METCRPTAVCRRGCNSPLSFLPFSVLFGVAAVVAHLMQNATAASASYLEAQYTGLEALYNATGGEQWTFSTGWGDAVLGVCGWHGVTCDSSGQNVTALSLAGNGLAGNLATAAELFDIVSLVHVDLSNNELVGPVAEGFGSMPGLELLDLSRNELSSFPANWGAGASSLQHLYLQQNNLSGTMPSEWLDVTSATSRPLVHSKELHSWFPELRTLSLGGNAIMMPVYHAIQSVVGFESLQTLDLSGNILNGDLEQSFQLHYCEDGDLGTCDSTAFKTGASNMAIVLLASNLIEGGLDAMSLPRSLSVLTVSDNMLHGPVPDDFSQLSVFMAEGNEGLNDTDLPSFASYANSSAVVTRHGNLSCPVISGHQATGGSVRLSIDPSYLGYSHCVCVEGMEGNFEDGCRACPEGAYRGTAELFTTRSCAACPADSWSRTTGAESASQCKCNPGFYDTLGGSGDHYGAPLCSACPNGGAGWDNAGAIGVAACTCPAGRYLDEASELCVECEPGTYKASVGNDASLCVPCLEGTYSSQTGGTDSGVCVPCEAGTYSASSGATSSAACLPCPSGTHSAKTGLFSAELCENCRKGYYSEVEGAADSGVCVPCPQGKFSSEIGASSRYACEPCPDGVTSAEGSDVCDLQLANSRRWLVIYLVVGASTLAGICVAYYTWSKKVHKKKKLMVDSRTDTPIKMTGAKRKAHIWAVFFHTLETIDVITGNALFAYLLDIGAIQGIMQFIYWLAVSMGVALNVHRLYMIIWMKWMLVNVSVAEKRDKEGKKMLVVSMPSNQYLQLPWRERTDRRIMTPDDAKMVLELVKILKHLQINKFKVQLAVVMDLPLTVLNLWLLWMVDPELIKSALFLTSLIVAVFSAGKISTLIEYHLELRQRKRKLERLLLLELKSSKGGGDGGADGGGGGDGDDDDEDGLAEDDDNENEEGDECFEHGQPETLLKFHGKSMRNIATKEAEEETPPRRRQKRIRYLKLSPTRRSPRKDQGGVIQQERGGGSPGPGRLVRAFSPRRGRSTEYAKLQEEKAP